MADPLKFWTPALAISSLLGILVFLIGNPGQDLIVVMILSLVYLWLPLLSGVVLTEADRVTLVRFLLVLGITLWMLVDQTPSWTKTAVLVVALILDGVDGYIARRGTFSSRHGSVFDMETDSVIMVLLAGLSFGINQQPWFIFAIPLFRPTFVMLAHNPKRSGRTQQKGSFFGKFVCIFALCSLVVAVSPPLLAPDFLHGLIVASIILLTVSFSLPYLQKSPLWVLRRNRY